MNCEYSTQCEYNGQRERPSCALYSEVSSHTGTIDTEIPAQVFLSWNPGDILRSGCPDWAWHWVTQRMGTTRAESCDLSGIAGACQWRQDSRGMIPNGNTRDQRTGNSQWNPNPRSVCWAFESRRKVNIELLASQTHELSAAETRPGYVLSELYPPLPPCVENLQVSMRETHSRGRRSNITPPCGRGEDTAPRRRITAQVGAGIKLTRV